MKHLPLLIRSDKGKETPLMAYSHMKLRRANHSNLLFEKIYSFGTSTSNIRIESWWSILAKAQVNEWRQYFKQLAYDDLFDGGSIDIIALRYIYMPMLRKHLHEFVEVHNNHRIRYQRNRAHYLPTGRPYEMYHYPINTHHYAEKPNETVLQELENQVKNCDIDRYLTESTFDLCTTILKENRYPTTFEFEQHDLHRSAYLYLRTELWKSIERGIEIEILQSLTESMNWIEAQEKEELKHEQLLNRSLVLEDDDSKIDDDQLLKEEELEERINSDDDEKELIFDF